MSARTKLEPRELEAKLASVPGWTLDQGKLYREFRFANFVEAFAFMTKVALLAEKRDHHPDWSNVYGTVRVHLFTHDVGGVTERDLELAAGMNAAAAAEAPVRNL